MPSRPPEPRWNTGCLIVLGCYLGLVLTVAWLVIAR